MSHTKSAFHEFVQDAENRRAYQQEKLIIDTTEMIAAVMEQKGITRAELAKRIGKTRAFITQVLSGNQNLTLRTLADVLWALQSQGCIQAVPLDNRSTARRAAAMPLYRVVSTPAQTANHTRSTPAKKLPNPSGRKTHIASSNAKRAARL